MSIKMTLAAVVLGLRQFQSASTTGEAGGITDGQSSRQGNREEAPFKRWLRQSWAKSGQKGFKALADHRRKPMNFPGGQSHSGQRSSDDSLPRADPVLTPFPCIQWACKVREVLLYLGVYCI